MSPTEDDDGLVTVTVTKAVTKAKKQSRLMEVGKYPREGCVRKAAVGLE
jgi:hypothetical protein